MSKHTPGPWSYDFHGINGGGEHHSRIATFSKGVPYNREVQDADGHLMAAAPDLAAALEVLLNSTCGDIGDDGYVGCIRIEAAALDLARDALAKARGTLA